MAVLPTMTTRFGEFNEKKRKGIIRQFVQKVEKQELQGQPKDKTKGYDL